MNKQPATVKITVNDARRNEPFHQVLIQEVDGFEVSHTDKGIVITLKYSAERFDAPKIAIENTFN